MFAPEGTSLALHDMTWLNSGPAALIQWVIPNRVLVFNLLWLASLAFSGYLMYLYARKHIGDGVPAFIAGCLFAFSTYHLHHGAQLGSMWIGWLPLFQLYIEDALAPGGKWKSAGKAALVLGLAAYTHWYLAAFCIFQLLFTLIWNAFTLRPFPIPSISRVVFILVTGCILILPILIPAAVESGRVENIQLKIEQRERYGADIMALITPSPRHPLWGKPAEAVYGRVKGNITESPIYPGWILYLLVIAGFVAKSRGRFRLLFLSLCFLVLALGTRPNFLGNALPIPLPYALFEYIPGLDFIRVPARFIAPALLFLSLLAAMGAKYLLDRISRPTSRDLFAVVIILLALLDTTVLPMPVRDTTRHSDFYNDIAKEKGDFLIFDYPSYTYQEYLFFQTIHEKPIIAGYGVYLPPERADWLITLNSEPWNAEGLGVKYIILHKGYSVPFPRELASNSEAFKPDVYFNENPNFEMAHDDRWIRVFKVR